MDTHDGPWKEKTVAASAALGTSGQPSPNRFRNLGDMRMLRLGKLHD